METRTQNVMRRTAIGLFAILLGLSMALVMSVPAQAFHFPWDQGHDTTDWDDPPPPGPCEGDNCDPCSGTGSPVYLITGHLIWGETDLAMMGQPELSVNRTYNSHDPRDGLFGNGWTSGCEIAVFRVDDSDTTHYVLRLGDGKRYDYLEVSPNRFESAAARFDYIEAQLDGSARLIQLEGSYQTFDSDGLMVERVDRNGRTLRYSYMAGTGLPARMFDDNGRYIEFTYNSTGRVSAVTDHVSRTWTYQYDSAGNLISVTDPLGSKREYTYQSVTPTGDGFSYQQLTSVTDETGVQEIAVTYDAERVASYTEGENRFSYSYDVVNRRVTKTDRQNSRWIYEYDSEGLITKETDPLGNSVQSEFNADGLITKSIDQLGRIELSTYDSFGRRTSEVDALGNRTQWEYAGDKPWPIKIISPTGRVTEIAYDVAGNPLRITNAADFQSTREYNTAGDLIDTTDALGNSTEFTYNAIGLVTSITDALGQITTVEYDALGNLISVTDPEAKTTTYSYDALNRQISVTDPSGITMGSSYDSASRLTTRTDAKDNAWQFQYDSFGRLNRHTTPDGRVTAYAYRNDNLVSSISYPGDVSVTFQYDAAGQVVQRSVAGQAENYSYDARGDLSSAVFEGLTYFRTYDDAGRLVQERGGIADTTVNYSYSSENELIGYQFPGEGIAAEYTHDNRGLLTSVAANGGSVEYQYDAAGRLVHEALSNNVEIFNTFDAIGQITRINHGLAAAVQYGFSYDGAGRLISRSGGGINWNYAYDSSGQLVSANNGPSAFSYQYDVLGNRLNNGARYDVFNKLLADDTYDYSYDIRGNLLQKTTTSTGERHVYSWDGNNRLISYEYYTDGNSASADRIASYRYNPFGERIQKIVDGQVTNFLWADGRLVAELDASNQVMTSYAYADEFDFPVSVAHGDNTYFVHTDHLDTPQFLTDASGTVVWSSSAEPYGSFSVDDDPDGDGVPITFNLRFPGQYYDAESQLHYNFARYYDPQTGRYLAADPAGLIGNDINLYRYVQNNPVTYVDPLGLGKGGKGNQLDTGLQDLSDEEVARRARDRSLSGEERRRYQKEEKARGQRNKEKRKNNKGKGKGDNTSKFCPLPDPSFQPTPSFDPTPYIIGAIVIVVIVGAVVLTGGGAAAGVPALASDRRRKRDVEMIDSAQLLDKLATLEVQSWRYDWESEGTRHIGPMAQDFHELFGLGDNDTRIEVVDASGVLYAAVRELYSQLHEKDDQIAGLERRLRELEGRHK